MAEQIKPEDAAFVIPAPVVGRVVALCVTLPYNQVAQTMTELQGLQAVHMDRIAIQPATPTTP